MAEKAAGRGVRNGVLKLLCLAVVAACSADMSPEPSPAPKVAAVAPAAAPPAVTPARAAAARAAPALAVTSILEPDRPMEAGDYIWNADAAPAGPLQIVADIEAERLYVYRGGVEIGRSSLIYGADDKPTPFGTFPILEKKKDHISNLYDAEMPYMLRLTWDGIAIHGSEVDSWSATHGCIGLPDDFAALLFAEVRLGDKVTITKSWLPEIYEG